MDIAEIINNIIFLKFSVIRVWQLPELLVGIPMIENFQTVFEVLPGPSKIQICAYKGIALGVVILSIAFILMFFYKTTKNSILWKPKLLTVVLLFLFGFGTLIYEIHFLMGATRELNTLLSLYNSGNYQIVEGEVSVSRIYPKTGHAPPELVKIAGEEFEIKPLVTHAYNSTIVFGGFLREGVYAKIYHYNKKILRIDIKESNANK